MKFRFDVPGMTCGGCEIETDVPGRIVSVHSSRDSAPLIAAIKAAGYDARAG